MRITSNICCIFILAFLPSFQSCRHSALQTDKPGTYIEVTDFRGTKIILSKPATRIICLIESALSGLYMLQAEDQVIGIPSAVYNESARDQYALLDDRIRDKKLPSPGNWDFVSIHDPNLAFLFGDDFLFVKDKKVIRSGENSSAWDIEFLKTIYHDNIQSIPYNGRALLVPS